MSDGVLSQEEINALLSGGLPDADTTAAAPPEELTPDERQTKRPISAWERQRQHCFP